MIIGAGKQNVKLFMTLLKLFLELFLELLAQRVHRPFKVSELDGAMN